MSLRYASMSSIPDTLRPAVQKALGSSGASKPTRGGPPAPRTPHGANVSAGEALWDQAWLVFAPKPTPLPRAEVRPDTKRRWRIDRAWPALRVGVEVDGGQYAPRGGRHATDADRDKLNHLAAAGWLMFRFSPAQLRKDPGRCVALVVRALIGRAG